MVILRLRRPTSVLLLAGALAALALPATAQETPENLCDQPGEAPNVIVGEIDDPTRWGMVNGITAFSFETVSCNVGTCWLNWITGNNDNRHPIIGQNIYRLENGRFEHIGQSWLKHGFYALSLDACSPDCVWTDGEHLGVNCSDPYSSDLNATQRRLGPKFEVDPARGFHPHPVSMLGQEGDAIFKRLQVHNVDFDPALHPNASFFVEAQYVTQDDAAAGNHHDNASYRAIRSDRTGSGNLTFRLNGATVRTRPAIFAWQAADPGVQLAHVDDGDGGRYWVGGKATDNGDGTWQYEYAVFNLDSTRACNTVRVPVPTGTAVTDIGFHDVAYHSGEPYHDTDWSNGTTATSVAWWTESVVDNVNANALRWGTLYNYRFRANRGPVQGLVTLGMYAPGPAGSVDSLVVQMVVPGNGCNGDGRCDAGEDCVSCPGECNGSGPDNDGDGAGFCVDCNDNEPAAWEAPGEVPLLLATRGPVGEVEMTWQSPLPPGSSPVRYEVLRAPVASDFVNAACLVLTDVEATAYADRGAPTAGPLLYYLVRAQDRCAAGASGTTGGNSFGVPRVARSCQ